MEVRSFWHINEEKSMIRVHEISENEISDAIQLRTLCSNISLGTERLVAKGKIPPSLFESMKVPHQLGEFSFPIQYGYSLVGEDQAGNRFHTMHPHQDAVQLKTNELTPVPSDFSKEKAAQISNMETVVNAIWDSGFQYGDQILICGMGSIGILLALTLKNQIGIDLTIKETNPEKQEILKSLGFDLITDDASSFDICFHCSGTNEGLNFCLEHTKTEGKIIELSWYGKQNISLQLGMDFHYKRIKIISSQVSQIPNQLAHKQTFILRKDLVIQLLHQIEIPEILYHSIAFEELPMFFQAVRAGEQPTAFLYTVNY